MEAPSRKAAFGIRAILVALFGVTGALLQSLGVSPTLIIITLAGMMVSLSVIILRRRLRMEVVPPATHRAPETDSPQRRAAQV